MESIRPGGLYAHPQFPQATAKDSTMFPFWVDLSNNGLELAMMTLATLVWLFQLLCPRG